MQAGIEAIEFQPGSLVMDMETVFAEGRGEDPEKYTKGLGIKRISLPDSDEDIVTIGATAALDLMQKEGIEPDDIGRLDVATESSFDRSKPVSTYIAGCLEEHFEEDFGHVNKSERKFACISGTQSIHDSVNWIQAGANENRMALVIATDLAFYKRGGSGEATQGSGAVAMLIDKNPSIATIERNHGYSSHDQTDFLKPNQQYPSVDGSHSVQVYLNRMRDAIEAYGKRSSSISSPNQFELTPFHVPFPSMVKKAAPLGYRKLVTGTDIEEKINQKIGSRPSIKNYDNNENFTEDIQDWMENLRETEEYREWYQKRVKPTIEFSSRVGNLYTGSVHLARLSGLYHAYKNGRNLTGDKILVASYGSGAQAEVHSEIIQSDWEEKISSTTTEEKLNNRTKIESFKKYEEIHRSHEHGESRIEPISQGLSKFEFVGFGKMGERVYEIKY